MNMKKKAWMGQGLLLGIGLSAVMPLWAQQVPDRPYGLELKITGQDEDDRDLGTRDGGDVQGIGIDVRPWVFAQRGDWSAFAMGQAVAATDIIESDTIDNTEATDGTAQGNDDDPREPDKSYLALREFWINYAGLTPYPGEFVRLGRQRLRSDDGFWMDSNIEALRWRLDTTLLRTDVGIAQRFSEYRTDLDELDPEDKDRLQVFADAAYQWTPGHWIGAHLQHADDDGELPSVGDTYDELDKTYSGKLTWLALRADGNFFDRHSSNPLAYWAQLSWMTGDIDTPDTTTVGDTVTAHQSHDANAWAVDLGLRWRLDPNWSVGGGYARGSGGDDGDQFLQTGLESNRSNFTGTRSRVHRFGEAFRGELSNLQAATLFASWNLEDEWDASLIYHRFWRVDNDQTQVGDGGIRASIAADESSNDLGQEVDLVVTKYFRSGFVPASWGWDEPSTLVRFRGGLFKPGDAYGSGVDSYMHRAFVDVVWRF